MGPQLNLKCKKIEKATEELLCVLLPNGKEDLDAVFADNDNGLQSGTATPKTSISRLSVVPEIEEDLRPGELTQMREEKKRKELLQEAQYLYYHFNRKTLDALVRCTRITLESMRRRVNSPSALLYGSTADDKSKTDSRPAFKVNLTLAIPNIALKPTLEEVQTTLNNVVQRVIGIHKEVHQWGQEESAPVQTQLAAASGVLGAPSGVLAAQSGVLAAPSGVLAAPSGAQLGAASVVISPSKNIALPSTFYKSVSEHKDVAKMVSMLSTTISSAKTLLPKVLDQFKDYEHLWSVDRQEYMTTFLESNPDLSDFEEKIKEYMAYEEIANPEQQDQPQQLDVGSLALLTG